MRHKWTLAPFLPFLALLTGCALSFEAKINPITVDGPPAEVPPLSSKGLAELVPAEEGPMTPDRFVRLMKEFPRVNDLHDYERVGRHLGISFRIENNAQHKSQTVLTNNLPPWLEDFSYRIGDPALAEWKHLSLRPNTDHLCVSVHDVWAIFGDKPFLYQGPSPDYFPRQYAHRYYGFLYVTPEGWGINFDFNREPCLRRASISIKINRSQGG